jgi:hypothetical protein
MDLCCCVYGLDPRLDALWGEGLSVGVLIEQRAFEILQLDRCDIGSIAWECLLKILLSYSAQALLGKRRDDDLDLGLKTNEVLLFDLGLTDQTMVADLECLICGSRQMELPPDERDATTDDKDRSDGEKEHGQALASGASPQRPHQRDQQGHRDDPENSLHLLAHLFPLPTKV